MKEKIIAMIPARMGSSRYPGKPIIDIKGKTMIEHVWQRVRLNARIDDIYIATCDEEIKTVAKSFGAKVIMTASDHERCSDRVAEACRKLMDQGEDFDIILNIQGDEPLLHPNSLDLLIEPFLREKNIAAVNLIETLETSEEINNTNNVKAIFDQNGFALYFSRLPIPFGLNHQHYKQLGVYGLTKETILKYAEIDETPLEIAESVDMLRFIEHGIPVKIALSHYKTKGVDTPEDRDQVHIKLETDEIFQQYKNK
jgi:3-deoxy-manno-octulosonate cytidylyltransferase (CMP-KDO synthetase)